MTRQSSPSSSTLKAWLGSRVHDRDSVQFATTIMSIFTTVYGTWKRPFGATIHDLGRVERRLNCRLPNLLWVFYRLFGRHEPTRCGFDVFYQLGEMDVYEDHLLFCMDDQGVLLFGVEADDSAGADPPVVRCTGHGGSWRNDCRRLSTFLIREFCWQAANGGLPYTAIARIDKRTRDAVAAAFDCVGDDREYDLSAFTNPGLAVCVSKPQRQNILSVGCRDKEMLRWLADTYRITWETTHHA